MSRRNGRRLDRRNHAPRAVGIAAQFAALYASGDSWFDADKMSGSDLVDYRDPTHLLALGAGSLSAPAADALFGGAKSLIYTGTQSSVSTRAPSTWKYLHTGAGSTVFFVWAPTAVTATSVPWGDNVGVSNGAVTSTTSGVHSYAITGNAGVVANGAGVSPVVVNTAYAYEYRFATANTPNWEMLRSGVSQVSGANSFTPSTADPTGTLTIGSGIGGTLFCSMRFRAIYLFQRLLSTPDRATVRAFITAQTGLV